MPEKIEFNVLSDKIYKGMCDTNNEIFFAYVYWIDQYKIIRQLKCILV